ncbi:hypothetical protein EGT74_05330 [Chitinophaga lutea]|uniref:Uncharacterized protein n=1 Tax=Chitinophaga lutea TaxID=2488634 RepID=A0A3N4PZZ4_9BACT|nr:hypothetical protein EGT74_05330 [Chitinophaga lutea]
MTATSASIQPTASSINSSRVMYTEKEEKEKENSIKSVSHGLSVTSSRDIQSAAHAGRRCVF